MYLVYVCKQLSNVTEGKYIWRDSKSEDKRKFGKMLIIGEYR